jgi:CYTH domain-containing protein
MPTENELKFLLHIDSEHQFAEIAQGIRHIRQGYLGFSKGMSLRIRETLDGRGEGGSERYELTFKQKVKNRVIEVEKKLDQRDFEDLWNIAINRLEKIRYDVHVEDDLGVPYHWEVDAFKDHTHKTYIIVAEHEMPEDMETPAFVPPVIRQNLIYAVPRSDDRFASKKIADVKYAKKLYEKVKGNVS